MTCPRLIEVALPIREISVESVRDKSLRHGHISTLHLWWARRPLAACRAVVFASLVPDPDDPNCPPAFREAVAKLLKNKIHSMLKRYWRGRTEKADPDPYRPYEGIPDTPRNRLLTFIAKWSPEWIAFERGKSDKEPPPKGVLDDRCLVKWETSDPKNDQGREVLRIARELMMVANGGKTPVLLDPFAGGGAIPLEAARLGCQAIANDYNPVAYLILRATCEFPQKYGKPGKRQVVHEEKGRKVAGEEEVPNVLLHDVEYWAKRILEKARKRIGHLYPAGTDGHPVVGYLWARTTPCSNPTCRATIPLISNLLVCNKDGKRVALTMTRMGKGITFGIAKDEDIKAIEGTMLFRGDCRCPICKQPTKVVETRRAGLEGRMGECMVAVITETPEGKDYRPVEPADLKAFDDAKRRTEEIERPTEPIRPEVTLSADHVSNRGDITVHLYGMKTWGSLFNPRQLLAIQTLITFLREALEEMERSGFDAQYRKAVATYLGLWVSRNTMRSTTVGRWDNGGETFQSPFDMAKIAMMWDFAEANPFNQVTGGARSQLDWILRVITHESSRDSLPPARIIRGDGARSPLDTHTVDFVVTDPPYFDEIAYADLSDLFYIWLKRGLGDIFPDNFATPLTPKGDEATALKHRHCGSGEKAEKHFASKLSACFAEAKRVCKSHGVLPVMFAHQTTEAWTALINALLEAGLTITATYPIDTELKNRVRGLDSSALESSITVVCRPRQVRAAAAFQEVKREIEAVVAESVHRYWDYGFRGADLIVGCYGPAVGVFGRYERVERRDGSPVEVPELLELAKESALKAIAGEFHGDALSRLYFVWANLYGTGEQAWDDARLVAQVGGDSEDAMEVARGRGLFVVNGPHCRLALLHDRADRRHFGEDADAPLVDQLHRAMQFWKEERRSDLVDYVRDHELADHTPFWKLAQALFEVLPHEEEDWKLVNALLGERETLRLEARRAQPPRPGQGRLPGTEK